MTETTNEEAFGREVVAASSCWALGVRLKRDGILAQSVEGLERRTGGKGCPYV